MRHKKNISDKMCRHFDAYKLILYILMELRRLFAGAKKNGLPELAGRKEDVKVD